MGIFLAAFHRTS